MTRGRCIALSAFAQQTLRGDFVHDQLAAGRKIRILTVVDTFSRLSPIVDPRFSYKGPDVVAKLDEVWRKIGYPKTIRVDNGSEFVSRDTDLWAYKNNVTLDFSRPGKPTDNAFIEAFNSKLRSECLNTHWFISMADTCEKLEQWRRHYNEERPHSAIGNIPPIQLLNSDCNTRQPDRSGKTLTPSGRKLGGGTINRQTLRSGG